MKATDEYGLCSLCGGHGSLMRRIPLGVANLDRLRPLARARAEQEGVMWTSVPCPWCDGYDHVTPMQEARAEAQS